ncbi:MAG TPA: T9SS type A sorting domain-containing protein, partial [Chitinophagaceae bacterium]|nr:T9SS type A sorting domain-containing protein [Chitinophagaceae bacterium]
GWVSPPPGGETTAIRNLQGQSEDGFAVWPNPARRTLHFDKAYGLELYDISGKLVKTAQAATELSIFDLHPGMYFIRNDKGQTKKVIIE